MTHIFYLLGIAIFLQELSILRHPMAYLNKLKYLDTKDKNSKNYDGKKMVTDLDNMNDTEKDIIKMVIFSLFYFAWLVIGVLFASQWILFLGVMVFGLSVAFLRRRLYKHNTRKSISIIKFDAFVSSAAIAFIIINHFHNII